MAVPIHSPSDATYDKAVAKLRAGHLVAFPSETVYGLGADASQPDAVLKIFKAKGRPADHPLIVHVASIEQAARWTTKLSDFAQLLMAHFWPGPLTLILPKADWVPLAVTGGQDTVGIRCPAHPVMQELLHRFQGGIAGPSANKFGRISPTQAEHVAIEFGDELSMVIDGGSSELGIESTIIDLSGVHPSILRLGFISQEAVERVLGVAVKTREEVQNTPRVSGSLSAHYAPKTAMLMLDKEQLLEWSRYVDPSARLALWSDEKPLGFGGYWLATPTDAAHYAHDLYANLRYFDALNIDKILIQRPPYGGLWDAVHDRLGRAVVGSGSDQDV